MPGRRLEDLYARGRELSLDDGSSDPVRVWVAKLSNIDHEKAIRKAGAARAKVMLAARDRDSEEWQEAYCDAIDLGERDALVEYLIAEAVARFTESKEAELAFGEEWKKDGYLQGLRDAWSDPEKPLSDVYAEDPQDEEASRVFVELKRFADQVQVEVDAEVERLRRDYEGVPEEELREKALARFIELRAGAAWVWEYRRNEVFFSARDPDDHRKYYFRAREQVDELAPEVFSELRRAVQDLVVESSEGKGSGSPPSSSPSSEQPSVVAT